MVRGARFESSTSPPPRPVREKTAGFLAKRIETPTTAAKALARGSRSSVAVGVVSVAIAVAPALATSPDAVLNPTSPDRGGLGVSVAVLLVGGAILVALLIAAAARSGRPSRDARRQQTGPATTDAWREAGRRQGVPDEDEGTLG